MNDKKYYIQDNIEFGDSDMSELDDSDMSEFEEPDDLIEFFVSSIN